jgi:nucleoid-associated protein YgaU
MFDVYLRRRLTFIALLAALLVGGLQFATPSSGAGRATNYTVQPGDTLWSIASSHYGGDPRDGIASIESANHLPTDAVYAGDVLVLPPGA